MKAMKFKTNINCGSCEDAVASVLKSEQRILNFSIDTKHPDNILTVYGRVDPFEIIALVNSVGFEAEEEVV